MYLQGFFAAFSHLKVTYLFILSIDVDLTSYDLGFFGEKIVFFFLCSSLAWKHSYSGEYKFLIDVGEKCKTFMFKKQSQHLLPHRFKLIATKR